MDVSGIEPDVLELTPVDWTSHPAEAEDLLTREYTLVCDDVVHAGKLFKRTGGQSTGQSNVARCRTLEQCLGASRVPCGNRTHGRIGRIPHCSTAET